MKKLYMIFMSLIIFIGFVLLAVAGRVKPVFSLCENYIPKDEFCLYLNVNHSGVKYNLEWWRRDASNDGEYFLTIPENAENKRMTLNFTGADSINIDGKEYTAGAEIQPEEKVYTVKANGNSYSMEVLFTSDIPALHIETEDGVLELNDKNIEKSGKLALIESDGKVYKGEIEYIRGRGNFSWLANKKAFNVKLKNEVPLLGMDKSRDWALITNYYDNTRLKNQVATHLASKAGMEFSPDCRQIDLFINGEYWGFYSLMEKVEIAQGRVEITNLGKQNEKVNQGISQEIIIQGGNYGEKAGDEKGGKKWVELPNDPENITGGYLMEIQISERYGKTFGGFVSNYGIPVIIREPKMPSKAQVDYISGYFQKAEDAVLNPELTAYSYSDYMDVDSFAKMYVFQEYVKNLDGAITSLYMYKDEGGKLKSGPVWDFDGALGYETTRDGTDISDPYGEYIYKSKRFETDDLTFLAQLCRDEEFMKNAKEQWSECFEYNIDYIMEYIDSEYQKTYKSISADSVKWQGKLQNDSYQSIVMWHKAEIDTLKNFMSKRKEFMTEFLSDF